MKNTLIVGGVYELFLQAKKNYYLQGQSYNDIESYLEIIPDKEMVKECFKIYNANRQRKKNNWLELCKWVYAITHIKSYQGYHLIFGTLTFSDKTLESTSERTRTRYVTKYLSDHTFHYTANIDFGEKNNREHYHFIAMVKDDLKCKNWKYGISKYERIAISPRDLKRVKNYLLKLNNHSYKSSTKQKRIIRDRQKDSIIDYFIENIASEDFHKFKLLLENT